MKIPYDPANDKGGGQWTPLPKMVADIQIEEVDGSRRSSNDNPQLMMKGRVVTEGDHYDKKCTIWRTITENSSFILKKDLDAAGVTYSEVEGGLEFDEQELVGCIIRYDVRQKRNPKDNSLQNDFWNARVSPLAQGAVPADEAAPPPPRPAPTPQAPPQTAPAQQTAPAAAPTAPAQQTPAQAAPEGTPAAAVTQTTAAAPPTRRRPVMTG